MCDFSWWFPKLCWFHTGQLVVPLLVGADAKRVLRVLRKGGVAASNGPTARPFPLCMRRHLAGLHSNRHLRHHARHQLTLFFKGRDMSADEALAVWRWQFAHGRMQDFRREHRYHVRQAYGRSLIHIPDPTELGSTRYAVFGVKTKNI